MKSRFSVDMLRELWCVVVNAWPTRASGSLVLKHCATSGRNNNSCNNASLEMSSVNSCPSPAHTMPTGHWSQTVDLDSSTLQMAG